MPPIAPICLRVTVGYRGEHVPKVTFGGYIRHGMSAREHPGRLNTKSAPNARNGVTRPRGAGSEMILAAISRALFAVKS